MKTALLKVSILGLITSAFLVGCGSGGSKLANTSSGTGIGTGTGTTTPPPGTGTGTGTGTTSTSTWPYSTSGETVAFTPVSWEEVNTYVGIRPLNNPSNMRININMHKVAGTSFYAGKVQLGYNDSGQFYYGSFTAGDGKNANCENCRDNGLYEAAPNFWSPVNGVQTFMAYVQDQYGSLIIVMEKDGATADGQAPMLKGRIYYRNFAAQACQSTNPWAPNYATSCGQSPYRKCWYIYSGPFACYSNNMSQKISSTDFSDGTYRLLGYFNGVRSDVALTQ